MKASDISARAAVLYGEHERDNARRVDGYFGRLLAAEWLVLIGMALWISPLTWDGAHTHPHVYAAVILGGLLVVPPMLLVVLRPGDVVTRFVIAISQMCLGALLIHLSEGRIETHFHVFGSLAFLAFYRDYRVLVAASLVVAADNVVRGALWPESIYGIANAGSWRWLEHVAWIVFEDVFLVALCLSGRRDMRRVAGRHAELEHQAELQRVYDAERTANRAKTEFLANMSHEIRTPMSAIQGYADLLLEHDLDASERLNYVQVIRRNSSHLLGVINDVLDLSKIEAGRMDVERLDCRPAQLVADVASMMRVRAVEKRLDFQIRFATPIPETISTDPTRLRQILFNLVGNAIKFTERGRVELIARCEDADGPNARLCFEVADTGIGLTRTQLASLFQAFSQADASTTRRFGGSGLGLVICRRMAHMLGGEIHVESLAGRGSSFTLVLELGSLAGVTMASNIAEAGVIAGAEPAVTRLAGRVLLAEDGVDNQVLISTHLRKAGLDVTVAENGRIAVELALAAAQRGEGYDVILMDMQMPELDGYGATAKLRGKGYDAPIVALTAHAMTGDREKCLAAGCDDYLTKPIGRARLVETVRAAMRIAPATGEAVSSLRDDPDMQEILAAFVGSLPERAASLAAALDAVDRKRLWTLAHQLKGSGGGYGYPALSEAAAVVERLANDPDDEERVGAAVGRLTSLMHEMTRMHDQLAGRTL